jgi:hypothetical protein
LQLAWIGGQLGRESADRVVVGVEEGYRLGENVMEVLLTVVVGDMLSDVELVIRLLRGVVSGGGVTYKGNGGRGPPQGEIAGCDEDGQHNKHQTPKFYHSLKPVSAELKKSEFSCE